MKIDEAIALGNDLVALLRRQRQPDLLSEWMAQHVAECIVAARQAKGSAKSLAEDRCVATILQLWRHRAALPEGHRPYEKFEPILATLARLDPENDQHFYFDFMPSWKPSRKHDAPPKPGSVQQFVDVAAKLDHAARVVIEHLLNEATKAADQPITRKLLKSGVRAEDGPDIETVRQLLAAKNFGTATDEAARKILEKRLNDRIERLGHFLAMATITRREYQARLRRLRTGKSLADRKPKLVSKS